MTSTRDLLLHPVRLRIVQVLAGQPMRPLDLKAQLGDVAQASLYRHLSQLESGGLIQVVAEQRVRGGVERTYAVVNEAISLGQSDIANAGTDEHFRYFGTFLGTLLSDFASYLETSELDFEADGVGYRQIPLWLTDEEFDDMVAAVSGAIQQRLESQPDTGRRRRLLTMITMPDDRTTRP